MLLLLLQPLYNLRPPLELDHLDLCRQLFDLGVHRRLLRWRLRRRGWQRRVHFVWRVGADGKSVCTI